MQSALPKYIKQKKQYTPKKKREGELSQDLFKNM